MTRSSYIKDPKTGKELAKWCRVRDQEVDKIKGDEAAMMVGNIKVKDSDSKEVEKEDWEVLVLTPESEAYNVTGADIRDARASVDEETAMPEVLFSFNASGGEKFGRVTGEHVPVGDFRYKLAIVLDNELQTAPTLQSKITDSGRITGNFTQKEVEEIVGNHQRRQPARRPGADAGPRHDHRGHCFQVTRFHPTDQGRIARTGFVGAASPSYSSAFAS